ncbi:glycosyltransferase family 2 protein [Labilibaculum antarcticum]|uniref:Glycosyl transferase n=1 Tax=Labilibaculum antarcticum TaxID=1717717 RepID=A0A1Y1CH61_9BACT|nr:glycosyltransferase family 2 protein [Labilibaculum antarcticum]BAX78631.1 glycosyl transferase [Labilibaculum antarcticum]
MKVSIITPTYNSEAYIVQTILSIQRQTYDNWELLITDDCSSDKTIDLLNEFAGEDNRIKIFQLNINSGGGIARNNSIENATGRFIAFCDSDDLWTPDKLEKQIKFMAENDLAFTYSAYQKINEDNEKGGIVNPNPKLTYSDLLKSCQIGCLTAIYDTFKLGKVYLPEIRKRQDYGLWLKIFQVIGETRGLNNNVLGYYRVRSNSVSSNKFKAAIYHFKVLRQVGELGKIKACMYFFNYTIKGLLKYLK